jgi:hypothetical protein
MSKKSFPMKDKLLKDLIEKHVNYNITSYWDVNQDGIIELDGDYYIQYSHDYLLFCEYPFLIGSQLDAIDFNSDYPNFLQTILDKVA